MGCGCGAVSVLIEPTVIYSKGTADDDYVFLTAPLNAAGIANLILSMRVEATAANLRFRPIIQFSSNPLFLSGVTQTDVGSFLNGDQILNTNVSVAANTAGNLFFRVGIEVKNSSGTTALPGLFSLQIDALPIAA